MSHQDPSNLEHELSRLELPGLNAGLLDRLDSCACGTWLQLSAEEIAFEVELRSRFRPAAMSAQVQAKLESSLGASALTAPAALGTSESQSTHVAVRRHRPWWASAAAVAILGATAAWMLPSTDRSGQATAASQLGAHSPAVKAPRSFVPAGVNRVLNETRDEGVIWKPNQTPHRVLKVVYDEHVTLKDENGKTYQVKQPRVEYFVVPTQPH